MKKLKKILTALLCVTLACALVACGKTAVTTEQHNWDEGVVTKQPTCGTPGERVYTCLDCGETYTEVIEPTGQHVFQSGNSSYLATEPTENADGERLAMCSKCKQLAVRSTVTYAEYQTKVAGVTDNIGTFKLSAFGSSNPKFYPADSAGYDEPTALVSGHPRLLFTADDLPAMRAAIADYSNATLLRSLTTTANAYSSANLGTATDHKSADDTGPKGKHNCNEAILRSIMAKALLYQVTGVKLHGYEAILMMKQYMTTLDIVSVSNSERYYGYTMFVAAIVYDWCYDLMTEADQKQFRYGAAALGEEMEIGRPPKDQGAVCDHGCERQLLRDYLSFAVACADEEPSWYRLVGGRIYTEYVPVRNEFYKSGYTPQGISTYLPIRFGSDMWSAWILQVATGSNPYDADNMQQVLHSVFSRIVDGQYLFQPEGDSEQTSCKNILGQLTLCTWISAALYEDETAAAWAQFLGNNEASLLYILLPHVPDADKNTRYDDLDLILYNGGFIGEIVAHDGWGNGSCTVKMKVGNYTTSGHDHAESGSFQIYYKGTLAGDSGYYDTYGSTHYWTYHRSSIAHNTLAVNRVNRDGTYTTLVQRSPGTQPKTLNEWLYDANDKYHKADTVGVAWGYADAAKTDPVYAYIAGDITAAYESDVADAVTRRMLAVYDTGTQGVPMFLFVYDHVTTKYDTDRVTFLLHTINQPTVEGNTVTAYDGSGVMVLQSVIGGDVIETVGGDDHNYWLNGQQIATKNGENDGYWGRVEISADGAGKTENMLNVIYVTDAEHEYGVSLPAAAIENEQVSGSVIGQTAAVFVNSAARAEGALSFTTAGEGTLNYYVSGVAAGAWTVQVGSNTQTVTATEEGGLLVFAAPAGNVTLTPVEH